MRSMERMPREHGRAVAMMRNRPAAAIRNGVPWVMFTFGLGALVLFFPLAFAVEGVMVASNYNALPGTSAAGHASEAMVSVFIGGFLAAAIVLAVALIAGLIAARAGLSVFPTVVIGVVLMLVVTMPFVWLLIPGRTTVLRAAADRAASVLGLAV